MVVWSVFSFTDFFLFLLWKRPRFNSTVFQRVLLKYIENVYFKAIIHFDGLFLFKTKVVTLMFFLNWSFFEFRKAFFYYLTLFLCKIHKTEIVLCRKIIFHLIFMKRTEKLIFGVYSLKKLNHFGETDCLQSSEQLKKTLLHSEGPQNHQNTPTTQVQKSWKVVDF